jgi:hypothetical protein
LADATKMLKKNGRAINHFFMLLKISGDEELRALSQVIVHTILQLRKTKEKPFIFAAPKN